MGADHGLQSQQGLQAYPGHVNSYQEPSHLQRTFFSEMDVVFPL